MSSDEARAGENLANNGIPVVAQEVPASLATPTNLAWKDGSTATATWDAVEGANYYSVNVYVYVDGEGIGSTESGTSATEIDVQSQIETVIGSRNYETMTRTKRGLTSRLYTWIRRIMSKALLPRSPRLSHYRQLAPVFRRPPTSACPTRGCSRGTATTPTPPTTR